MKVYTSYGLGDVDSGCTDEFNTGMCDGVDYGYVKGQESAVPVKTSRSTQRRPGTRQASLFNEPLIWVGIGLAVILSMRR